MSDKRLLVFYTVAKVLSFTKAAKKLHMTQPAVTFQVRQLEEKFDLKLFDRKQNRIYLTEAGQKAFYYADKIFNLNNEMQHELKILSDEQNTSINLGGSTTVAQYLLPLLLKGFLKEYPFLKINITEANTEEIVIKVDEAEVDLGIVEAPVKHPDLLSEIFRADELFLIVNSSHPLSSQQELEVDQLLELPIIMREDGSGTKEVIVNYLKEHYVDISKLNVVMEFGNSESIKGAVEANVGVAILSMHTIQKELQLKTIHAIKLKPKLTRNFYFVRKPSKTKYKIIDELIKYAKEHN
tara:strand:+ start:2709 stop:3596 length:888 start_codon:yes stop_codon:yes gene_type:complete